MEMGVQINPVPKGLDGGYDPGRKRAPGHNLEVTSQGPEGAAAEIAEENGPPSGQAKAQEDVMDPAAP
jgi:hypothetical protein